MKAPSSYQIGLGRFLGIFLQPLSFLLVARHLNPIVPLEKWGLAIYAFLAMYFSLLPVPRPAFLIPSFGVAQVLTILPAALLFWVIRKHDVARGLLQAGTYLALANIALIIYIYVRYWSKIA